MSLDKITAETVAAVSSTGLFGGILYWINVRWRFAEIKEDLKEIKNTLNQTRSVETCNIMNHNIIERLENIERLQNEVREDIKKLLTMYKK